MVSLETPTFASTTTTLWATASKEWVIQPKPKPGRKPKNEGQAPAISNDEVDSKGRRVQNRAAQRAFRERKQSQLAELQARILSYEQGEMERNVALQNIAKRLKEENESLRQENELLKEKFSQLEQERNSVLEAAEKKRWRNTSPVSSSSPTSPVRKRRKSNVDQVNLPTLIGAPSPNSSGSSSTRFSPEPPQHTSSTTHEPLPTVLDFSGKSLPIFPSFNCGFCSEEASCVCRAFAMDPNGIGKCEETPLSTTLLTEQPMSVSTYQPAVPLRRRTSKSGQNTIFPINPPSDPKADMTAPCSGDPSNCMACADDTFGKAFCSALGQSVASQPRCLGCPSSASTEVGGGCCGKADGCLAAIIAPTSCSPSAFSIERRDPLHSDTMPTSEAWRQLKSHPNVSFADLTLLADVVAGRARCDGPKMMISLEDDTPAEYTASSSADKSPDGGRVTEKASHAKHYGRTLDSSLQLVPEDVLLRCGRGRVREVQTAAVRDALRLLDAKFA